MTRAWNLLLPFFIVVACLSAQPAQKATSDNMLDAHHHHRSGLDKPVDQAQQAKLLADKRESEFNHHLAGFFVALGGALILVQTALGKRSLLKYIWPASFLISGIFVLVWSDTELWPFGDHQWLDTLQHNREVLQHKVFAALLLGVGSIEWLRLKERLKTVWSAMLFPLLAIGGSILLLFHQHEGGMQGPDHMELMARIQAQHLSYAAVGIGIGLARGLSEMSVPGQRIFTRLWPLLMVALGVLLMFYRE